MKIVFLALLAVAIAAAAYWLLRCPCERVPGAWLLGERVETRVTDWRFANEAPLCQLEVAGALPHSINLNCMSDGANLYVSCSRCKDKYWSGVAVETGAGKLRVGDKVYPVSLSRVRDPAELDHAWQVRANKLSNFGRGNTDARPDHWWSFSLASR